MIKHLGMLLLAVVVGGFCLELGHKIGIPSMGGLVTPAVAIVGRPLTPVSVALLMWAGSNPLSQRAGRQEGV